MDGENEIMIRRLTIFFVPIAFAVILVIGLIGNILVIIVVSKITLYSFKHKDSNSEYLEKMIIFQADNILTHH